MSSSPTQAVVEERAGAWRGLCDVCSAAGDSGSEDAGWLWVDEHVCGVETIRLP